MHYFLWKGIWYGVTDIARIGDVIQVKSTNVKILNKREVNGKTVLEVKLTGSLDGTTGTLFYASESKTFQPNPPLST